MLSADILYKLFDTLMVFLKEFFEKCFVCFVALRPKSTAMVMAGWSVHPTTLFPGQAWTSSAHTFACNWQQAFLNDSAEGRRMTVEIISWSISTKVWDRARICSQTQICCQTRYRLCYAARSKNVIWIKPADGKRKLEKLPSMQKVNEKNIWMKY